MIPANLHELLNYDPHTGRFTWRTTRSSHAQAGKEAGTRDPRGYIRIQINRKLYWAHRLAFFLMTGREPRMVDHINLHCDDNRWSNLREVTPDQNVANQGLRSDNTSGVRGVSWCKRSRRYQTYIASFGKRTTLGLFANLEDATQARHQAEEAIFGQYSPCMEAPNVRA